MRTNIDIDIDLMRDAMRASGATIEEFLDLEVVHPGGGARPASR